MRNFVFILERCGVIQITTRIAIDAENGPMRVEEEEVRRNLWGTLRHCQLHDRKYRGTYYKSERERDLA